MKAARLIAVCVPIRNEAALLQRFLEAMSAQTGAHEVVMCALFDGCTDDSADIVQAHVRSAPFLIVTAHVGAGAPNAGLARRRAMELGMAHMRDSSAIILTTDADSAPAPDWLSANVRALDIAHVVAGRIVRDPEAGSRVQDRVETYYDALFGARRSLDPVSWEANDTHHYTSGASLGFRADAYRALGGFEAVPSAEDARLVDAAHRAGLRVRRDGAVRVVTSSRRTGRATNGLADHLRQLDVSNDAAGITMTHPEDACWRYAGHAAARVAWRDLDSIADRLAASLECSKAHIRQVAAAAPNAEAFATRIVPGPPGGERIVALPEAERALAEFTDRQRVAA